jgi:segregation and condensation protein B
MPDPSSTSGLSAQALLLRDVEALLFAAGRPLDLESITTACSHSDPIPQQAVEAAIAELEQRFPVDGPRGFELARVGEGWLFRTNASTAPALERLFDITEDLRLSPAATETLAIVAYLQPVSRPEIAEIRGVNSDTALHTLVDRDLVQEMGRRDAPGGAILYGTTSRFLVAFGLESLSCLPPIERFEVGEEQREELKRRLGLVVAPG